MDVLDRFLQIGPVKSFPRQLHNVIPGQMLLVFVKEILKAAPVVPIVAIVIQGELRLESFGGSSVGGDGLQIGGHLFNGQLGVEKSQ